MPLTATEQRTGKQIPFCSRTCLSGALRGQAANKYNSKRTWSDLCQRWFASKHECAICEGLWGQQQRGEIRKLQFQVPYSLDVNGQHICNYVADATWVAGKEAPTFNLPNGVPILRLPDVTIVADAKSAKTRLLPVYRLKRALMKAVHNVEIVEL